MPSSRRCSTCGIEWPYSGEYEKCPGCGETTDIMHGVNQQPLSSEAARSMKKRLVFARKYEESRGVPVDSDQDVDELACDCGSRPDGWICWLCDPLPRRPAGGEIVLVVESGRVTIVHRDDQGRRTRWGWDV
jgi:hypothetical protein